MPDLTLPAKPPINPDCPRCRGDGSYPMDNGHGAEITQICELCVTPEYMAAVRQYERDVFERDQNVRWGAP
ncbi:hypothetical protein P7F88_25375 [Vibrio hannami]|uniref:hypothetical protein n=1 Tax=Vibrio hannami TaxID=2717094 RepID=UPI00241048AF|nr:hypothetical protein [Vibrio hannami]MDG3089197.1 hypothetical protein [Vibrio hannami]